MVPKLGAATESGLLTIGYMPINPTEGGESRRILKISGDPRLSPAASGATRVKNQP
jgi:hypothetical protein